MLHGAAVTLAEDGDSGVGTLSPFVSSSPVFEGLR